MNSQQENTWVEMKQLGAAKIQEPEHSHGVGGGGTENTIPPPQALGVNGP